MTVSIEVEDDAWLRLQDLEDLARKAAGATFAAVGFDSSTRVTNMLFTDDDTITHINAEWRGKNYATNVLSFPSPDDMPVPPGEARPLGDIVMASGAVFREAEEQGKSLPDHTTHLIVHGLLHLLGHDHEEDAEAEQMERLETEILKGLGISDPYE